MKVNVVRRQKGSKNKMTEEERLELAKQQAAMFAQAEEDKPGEKLEMTELEPEVAQPVAAATVPEMTLEQFAPIRF